MNVHDLPMVVFTVVSQMSVGTFITLGVIQFVLGRRHQQATVDRVVAPVLYAIGPVLVFALVFSMLHLGDVFQSFNVIRHWDSSWLSREIIFGVAFAGFGFLFSAMEWFGWGSRSLRQAIAALTGLLGVGLLVAESMVYYSVVTVPAWYSWMVPFSFFATAALLGMLAVGAALMITTAIRARNDARVVPSEPTEGVPVEPAGERSGTLMTVVRGRIQQINAPTSSTEWTVMSSVLRWIALAGAVVAVAILVAYPLYLGDLGSQATPAAEASLAVLTGSLLWIRLACTALTALILGFFVYRMAETTALSRARGLVIMVLLSLALAFTGEFIGRLLHYESIFRVGI